MKILHLIYDDINNPWLGGGGAVRTYEIYKRLADRHEVTVITGNYPNAKKEEEKDGILYKRIGSDKNYLLSRLSYLLNAPKLIRRSDCDIIVEDFSAFSPCFSPLHTKRPVIGSIQNLFRTHAIKKYKVLGVIAFIFEKIGVKFFKNFIAVSPSIKKQLESMTHSSKIDVIFNGLDDFLLHIKSTEKNYILYLGRIEIYQKGIDLLLKAVSEIAKYKKIKLIIAGGGKDNDIDKLKNLINILDLEDSVEFLGKVSEQTKRLLLSNCLFVCMPSRFEAQPIVPLEAAACEKPVIGTKIPGLWDTVKDGETGILVEPDNPKKLAEGMKMLIENKDLRKKLGKDARIWARNFNWDNIAKEQEKFYLEILERETKGW